MRTFMAILAALVLMGCDDDEKAVYANRENFVALMGIEHVTGWSAPWCNAGVMNGRPVSFSCDPNGCTWRDKCL